APIERFTADGVEVNGKEYPLDAIVCATGFAAMTGSFDRIRITGRRGQTLAEKWRAGPRAYLGVATVGFPNLFTITGPGSPSVLASMIQAIEQLVDWMGDCMAPMRDVGPAPTAPVLGAEVAWRGTPTWRRSLGTRTPGSSTSPRCRRSRCARPAAPGTSEPTSPAVPGC